MRPGLVVWDCDGVLVDTERLVTRLEAEWITALGWPLTQGEVVDRFVGRTATHMDAEIKRHLGRAVPTSWHGDLREASHKLFRAELTAIDGVVDVLDRLDRAAVMSCVASSSDHDRLRLVLGLTDLYDRFGGRIHSAFDVPHGKPAPDLFEHAAELAGVAVGDCVVIEDSVPGVTGAVAAGMRVLGYAGGLVPAAQLSEAGAEIFEHMREVPARLHV
ncbi:MAG: HAD family phosphatase [Actinomycetota bacterium]|nr:HAD family phosphatase [Actinomycetota bacterium]